MTNIASSLATKAGAALQPGAASAAEKAELEKTAKAFEAIFVRKLIGEMREAGLAHFSDDLTGSSAVQQFQEMADAKTADHLADKGGLGIAQMMLSQLAPKVQKPAAADAAAAHAAVQGDAR